jgi:uncharacterized membrane protein YbhN (UPF0104 family)
MSEVVPADAAPGVGADPTAPSGKRRFQPSRLIRGAVLIVVIGAFANLLGLDISAWISDLWDTINEISAAYLAAAVVLKTVQTTATAYAWYSILRFAYADRVRWREILACYAASVALNGVLPANLGTLVFLLMLTMIIAGATFAAIIGGYAVQKIFFTISGLFVYLYLFLTVEGSFDVKFEFVHTHTAATVIMLAGGAYILYVLARRAWPRVLRWWEDAKEGGGILVHPRAYFWRVFVPELVGWIASLAVIGVFLAAYGIPVTFHTLMRICGGNSIANVTSVTPGGAGVTQAFNVASLKGVASPTDAAAYSVAQQLVTTAWSIVLAVATLVYAFGWTGGKKLVGDSYTQAKEKAAEQKDARAARKSAKREAEAVR